MSNNTHAFRLISSLCKQCYMQPKVVEQLMRKSLIATLQYQSKLWSRILIERLLKKHIGLPDVQSVALKQLRRNKNKDLYYKCINSIMNINKESALREENRAKSDMTLAKIELKKEIKLHTIAGNEFTSIVDYQWNVNWIENEKHCVNKISWLKAKQVKKLEEIVNNKSDKKPIPKGLANIVMNVKYKDKDIITKETDNKPINLGSAPLNKNVEKVLSLPTGYTVYKNVSEKDMELCIEEGFAKGRWKNLEINKCTDEDKPNDPSNNPYDPVDKVMNFQSIKATDMKSNKRVRIVEQCELEIETKLEFLKLAFMDTHRKYASENKNAKYSNLDTEQQDGLNQIVDSINDKKVIVSETDKSKRFSVNEPVAYVTDMNVHVKNDKVINQKHVNRVTKMFNDTSKSIVKIVGMEAKEGQYSRIINNIHVSNESELPVLSGLYKDHKQGRKFRALVNGNVGPISNLSEIFSISLKPYLQELQLKVGCDNTVKST